MAHVQQTNVSTKSNKSSKDSIKVQVTDLDAAESLQITVSTPGGFSLQRSDLSDFSPKSGFHRFDSPRYPSPKSVRSRPTADQLKSSTDKPKVVNSTNLVDVDGMLDSIVNDIPDMKESDFNQDDDDCKQSTPYFIPKENVMRDISEKFEYSQVLCVSVDISMIDE